ncbi:MAG: bifunctional phosphoribosylaminoimidazolecarboxamide formyltransferase/IMP cyclohydrolase [Candidatus Cloacimonetes bacterium]|nr:bifunctional phosphoribosylaminoimidazolecarboxamide formyltransferase/IMP cyclohydrolase [Candidatus Cloacimonadota bacterium]
MNEVKIKRVLISVSDKTGIIDLARKLLEYKCEIISTGGTRRILEEAGIRTTEISAVTGNPEAFGGRMKTISFAIESALLFDREKDKKEAQALGILPIDLVVCNLYPFQKKRTAGAELPELIENIDIGGPTMLRAAAKNYKWVATLTDIADYPGFLTELEQRQGKTSEEFRFELMRKTFNHTANYDSAIALAMDEKSSIKSQRLYFTNGTKLRYGENSHQEAYIYEDPSCSGSLAALECLHGKDISYNNILDIEAAVSAVSGFPQQAVAVVKHLNTCGFACGEKQHQVFEQAWSGDPVSAFGSIIAFNQKLTLQTVEFLQLNALDKSVRKFIEVIIAPDFDEKALSYLKFHKNLRIVRYDPARMQKEIEHRLVYGSLLQQTSDNRLLDKLEQVTISEQNDVDSELVEFGLCAVRNIRSNAIVIVQRTKDNICRLLGMGTGQPNRLISTKLAIDKARENLLREVTDIEIAEIFATCILVSDAYFPFADNIEIAAEKGIRIIVQPGGSLRDKAVIKRAEELGVQMILTGLRHFKH